MLVGTARWAWLGCLTILLALPTPLHAAPLSDRLRAAGDLALHEEGTRAVPAEGVTLTDGALTVTLETGVMVPIVLQGLGPEPAGFAWAGEGRAEMRFDERVDAMHLASRLVRDLDGDRLALAPVAAGDAPLHLTLDAGVFILPVSLLVAALPPGDEEDPDALEVFIYGERDPQGARLARRAFSNRRALYVDLPRHTPWDRDPARIASWGRGDRFGWPDDYHAWIDLRTDKPFGELLGAGPADAQTRWLTWARDDRGGVRHDPSRVALASLWRTPEGQARAGWIGATPFPAVGDDPLGPRAPALRFEPGEATTVIRAERTGLALNVEATSELSLTAVGGPLQWLELAFHGRQGSGPALTELALADGTPVQAVTHPPLATDLGPEGGSTRVEVVLPRPVAEGESVRLVARSRERWPFARDDWCYGPDRGALSIPTTELFPIVPQLRGSVGTWRAEGITDLPPGLRAIGGGAAGALSPQLAIGTWRHTHEAPAGPGYPAVHVHMTQSLGGQFHLLAPEVRRMVGTLGRWLPSLDADALQVVELPQRCVDQQPRGILYTVKGNTRSGPMGAAQAPSEPPRGCGGHGTLPPKQVVPFRRIGPPTVVRPDGQRVAPPVRFADAVPHHDTMRLAHDIAHLAWGSQVSPADTRELWIAETLAEAYACMTVGAAFTPEECGVHMELARSRWESGKARRASLTAAWGSDDWPDIVWFYGPYVMLEMLRPRIGDEPFFRGLDSLLAERSAGVTTERLRHHLERASGRELGDFFDFWVHQGLIPELSLQWSVNEDAIVQGVVTSDVPFGTFDVPVHVTDARGVPDVIWVEVIDGRGTFSAGPVAADPAVALDPDGRVLARARQVSRVEHVEIAGEPWMFATPDLLEPGTPFTSEEWSLADESWWIDDPVEVSHKTGDLELRSGYAFRVDDATGPVGAVFVADGTWTLRFEDAREARRFANRRVLASGDDPQSLAGVVDDGAWPTSIDRGALFGVDVWPLLGPSLVRVESRGGALLLQRGHAIEELLVVEHANLQAARRAAERLLVERTRHLRERAYDPAAWVAMDRLEGCRRGAGGEAACNRLADLRTSTTWDRYAGVDFVGAGGRWLGWLRDPRGVLDPRHEEQVSALAVDSNGQTHVRPVTRARMPLDAFGVPTAPHRVDLHRARVLHDVQIPDGTRMDQDTVAELMVRAVGGEARVVVIDIPHVEQRRYHGMHPLRNGWALRGVELADGTPLRHTLVPLTPDQREGRGDARTLLVELPEPLAADRLAAVRVRYRDHHRYAHHYEYMRGGPDFYVVESTGVGTSFAALPRVRGHGGFPVEAVVRVALPARPARSRAILGGDHQRTWRDEHRRYTEVQTPNGEVATVAIGNWSIHREPPRRAAPAITAALQPGHHSELAAVAAVVRQAVAFHESLLFPAALRHLSVAELGSTDHYDTRLSWGDQLVAWSPSFPESRGGAFRLHSAFAWVIGIHQQWWRQTGAFAVEPSLSEQMGAAYARMFLSRVASAGDFEKLTETAREIARTGGYTPLSQSARPEMGGFVLGTSLRAEVGDEAFFQAVHHVVIGNAPPTWDGLQFAMEQTSGRDLADWFDVWVHGDRAPSVDSTWERRGTLLHGEITTDIPFGRFRVPVEIDGTVHQVELVDGQGTLTVPVSRRRPRIAIDPDATLLLRRATVSRR